MSYQKGLQGYFWHRRLKSSPVRYHSIAELATILLLLKKYPKGFRLEKLSSSRRVNPFAMAIPGKPNWYCPDFAIFKGKQVIALGECKAKTAKDYLGKQKLLKSFCKKIDVSFEWYHTTQPDICRTSTNYLNARKYHEEAGGEYKLVVVSGKKAHYFASHGIFIDVPSGNRLFERECFHCGFKLLTRHSESKRHNCGPRNSCLRDKKYRKSGHGLCATCRRILPATEFPKKGIHCRHCLRTGQGIGIKVCLRCQSPLPLGPRSRVCAECSKGKCANCGATIVVVERTRYERVRDGLPLYCSPACNIDSRTKNRRYELICTTCSRPFNAPAAQQMHCYTCLMATCKNCRKRFTLSSPQCQKLRRMAKRERGEFNLLKLNRYRCRKCLE